MRLSRNASSQDLDLLIISDRVEQPYIARASRATANILNHSVFPSSDPLKSLAEVLGATGEYTGECLNQNILPPGYDTEKAIFPVSDLESSSKPLVKGRYHPNLHLAIGCLRTCEIVRSMVEGSTVTFTVTPQSVSNGLPCWISTGPCPGLLSRALCPPCRLC